MDKLQKFWSLKSVKRSMVFEKVRLGLSIWVNLIFSILTSNWPGGSVINNPFDFHMFDTTCMLDEIFPKLDADFIDNLVLFVWIGVVRNYKILFVLIDKLRNGFLLKRLNLCKLRTNITTFYKPMISIKLPP